MKSGIIIVSVGAGDPDLLNIKTVSILRKCGSLFLRTGRHPISAWLKENGIPFSTFDHFYEVSDDFDLLNRNIADSLIRHSSEHEIVYAVPDPLTDQTVRILMRIKPDSLPVSLIPGISGYDFHLSSALGLLPDTSVLSVPASELNDGFFYDPNRSLLVTELDNPILAGQVKLYLSELLEDEYPVWFLRNNGRRSCIPLWQLDRQPETDHMSAVLIPGSGLLERKRFVMSDLSALMDKLRSPSGCPWDRKQTHSSLRPYMIEEAWECVACIDQDDMDHFSEELGDLLFQIVFHASIGKSFDEFSINDVISSICNKMIRRHPHVFGSAGVNGPESLSASWDRIKQEETGHFSAVSSLDDVSPGLPALKYAAKSLRKLRNTPAVRSDPLPVLKDLSDLASELAVDSCSSREIKLGRLLLLCSELCSIFDQDSELLLHQAVDRFKSRMKAAENQIISDGKSLEHLTFHELGVYLEHVEDEIE